MSAEDHAVFMTQALSLAKLAGKNGEVPVGAVLVKDGEVMGEGWNRPISRSDPTAHAEIVALRAACQKAGNYRLPGAVLYVTIEPCTMCVGALMHARVSRIVFGAPEPKAGAVCSQQHLASAPFWNHQIEIVQGVLKEEAAELMQVFFAERRADQRRQKGCSRK